MKLTAPAKRILRRALRSRGYAVRDIGHGVGGVELLHDAASLVGAKHNPLLFDIGANVGHTTMAMADIFRRPIISAFEPSPATFERLKANVGSMSGVTVQSIAFGDTAGTLPFYVTRDHSVNDSLRAPTWDAGGSIAQVDVQTIDQYCDRNKIDIIDFVKIDTQGNDLNVLKGAIRMLRGRKIKAYCCEANMFQMYEDQPTLLQLLGFAEQIRYDLVGFYEQSYVDGRLSYLDILFVAN